MLRVSVDVIGKRAHACAVVPTLALMVAMTIVAPAEASDATSAPACEGGLRPPPTVTESTSAAAPAIGVVAYTTDDGLWLAGDADGGPRQLASTAGYLDILGWSPDGSSLLVRGGHFEKGSRRVEHNCSVLYLVRADGTGVTALSDDAVGSFANAGAVSPDGASVAYEADSAEWSDIAGSRALVVREPTGGSRVIEATLCEGTGANADRLIWSPDGRYLGVRCEGSARAYDMVSGAVHELVLRLWLLRCPRRSGGSRTGIPCWWRRTEIHPASSERASSSRASTPGTARRARCPTSTPMTWNGSRRSRRVP